MHIQLQSKTVVLDVILQASYKPLSTVVKLGILAPDSCVTMNVHLYPHASTTQAQDQIPWKNDSRRTSIAHVKMMIPGMEASHL